MGRASRKKAEAREARRRRPELLENLQESVDFLKASSAAFDEGFEAEAKRLAVTIRVLLHDTEKSKSLLSQLGVKEDLYLYDTSEGIIPTNLAPTPGLVMMQMTAGQGGRYVPPLGDLPPSRIRPAVKFGKWWGDNVTKLQDGTFWTRRKYVLVLANKEGGAHVDPVLDSDYENLARKNALGFEFSDSLSGREGDFEGSAVAASVRQIAYEVTESLNDFGKDLLRA
ncbi:hypothetical protein ACFPK1_29275 [Actinomycetospora rhizophila]|uniref:Uncharacterized protein n=1 Tax=Actinomycetospora rhizophila TaxID=1416876 RepID=A0ABV9ZNW6_9PSEU